MAAFDTLTAAKTLEATGLPSQQASSIVAAILAAQGDHVSVATLQAELAKLEARLTIRMAASIGVGVGVIAAIVRFWA